MAAAYIAVLGLCVAGLVSADTAQPITLGGGQAGQPQQGTGVPQQGGSPSQFGGGLQQQPGRQPPSIPHAQHQGGQPAFRPQQSGFPHPALPSFEFTKLFEKYFQNLDANFQAAQALSRRFHHSSASAAVAFPPWTGKHHEWHNQVNSAHQAAVANLNTALAGGYGTGGYGYPGGFPAYLNTIPGSSGGPQNAGPIGASATGVIGPQGTFQSASLYPENADKPNVFVQSGAPVVNPGANQFYSVQTSSIAGSSDVNGKKTSFQKAQTTVNDNGKISTYNLGDP